MQSLLDEVDHLVFLTLGEDAFLLLFVPLQECIFILGETKEVALLFDDRGRFAAIGAKFVVDELRFGKKCLAADAVVTLIVVFVDISFCQHRFKRFLHPFDVRFVSRTDEFVVTDVEVVPEVVKLGTDFVCVLLRFFSTLLGRFLNLLPMFIGSGQEECL
ncbi:hypothetical protein D1872_251030 [compost metagenome]